MSWIRDVGEVSFGSVCAPLKAMVDGTWSNDLMLRSQLQGGKATRSLKYAQMPLLCVVHWVLRL